MAASATMLFTHGLLFFLIFVGTLGIAVCKDEQTQYCIIGAGPGGMQVGYFLERAGREYIIFEKNSTAGSFYLHYPRHRTMISINKRNTGSTNKEFNFRHDWNSLISDDETLQMRHYSRDYFPHADDYVRYLQDYAARLNLNIKYNTEIVDVRQWVGGSKILHLEDRSGTVHRCKVVIVSTGVWVPNIPIEFPGIEYAVGYEEVSTNPEDFENKVVLIFGRGNAGFETADHIVSHTAYIHMSGRSRVKLAYQTHYVGDLRAVNDQQIDTYQLKSLDGQFEGGEMSFDAGVGLKRAENGQYFFSGLIEDDPEEQENFLFRHPYDVVIRCLGFKFDLSIFNSSVPVKRAQEGVDKYPHIGGSYEVVGVQNMFVAGAATHSLDYRKSAGGFIHGFRYTARALFHHLEWQYHGVPWPSVTLPAMDLLNHMIRRINEASGLYQMFGVLGDVILIRDNETVVYLEEVPLKSMPHFKKMTGHKINRFIVWTFQYGKDYSGPGKDVLHEDRVTSEPLRADRSNFLHPVIYYYGSPPNKGSKWEPSDFPEPDQYHHVVEDFLTDWTSRSRHIIPLRRFLEGVLQQDLRNFFAETCFELFLSHGSNVPSSCKQHYLKGFGVSLSDKDIDFGPPEVFGEL